jgi:hypothetical protein
MEETKGGQAMNQPIQPNELRVGSVLMYVIPKIPRRIAITSSDITWCNAYNEDFNDEHRPIPLTPELLLEMGATVEKVTKEYTVCLFHGVAIVWQMGVCTDYSIYRTPLPYLHTLQNFIYAVKGIELTINTK